MLNNDDFNYTTLLPLFTQFDMKTIIKSPSNVELKKYVSNTITYDSTSTILPFNELNYKTINEDNIQSDIYDFLKVPPDKNSYYYVLGEYFSNIVDHSEFTKAYFTAQEYPNEGLLDLNIIDDGVSIPGSYSKNPNLKDNEYMEKAIKGESTKNECLRGFGLRTTVKYITSVPRGEILIVSHRGLYYKKNNKVLSKRTKYGHVDGTFISIRFDSENLHDLMHYVE